MKFVQALCAGMLAPAIVAIPTNGPPAAIAPGSRQQSDASHPHASTPPGPWKPHIQPAEQGPGATPSLTVQTSNGAISGHSAPLAPAVNEFLGIPYAAPPLGDLRFAAPAAYTGSAPLTASTFAPRCPQTQGKPVDYPEETPQGQQVVAAFAAQDNYTISEDCLALNIWTKPTAKSYNSTKPVLVFFYGGRFSIGDTNSIFYTGQFLADAQDVIVVTVGYRINIFGFPGAPNIDQNIALLDIRQAVEWVSQNIGAFGGDADKITIFGQSSGSVLVDYYSYLYAEDPLVAGFISHSGNAFSFPTNTLDLAQTNWYNVSGQLGCGTSGDVLPCMRNQTIQNILTAVGKVKPPSTGSLTRTQPGFQPIVDGQIVFSVDEYLSRVKAGQVAKKPYLWINNNYEQGYYKIPAFAQGNVLPESDWTEFLAESFTCPNTVEAYYRSQTVPSYLLRYFGDWNNTRLYPTSGAYHGSEVGLLLGATEQFSGLPEEPAQTKTKELLQSVWAAFADDPANGLGQLGYPTYDRSTSSLVQIALNETPTATFVAPQTFDSVCPGLNLTFYDVPA